MEQRPKPAKPVEPAPAIEPSAAAAETPEPVAADIDGASATEPDALAAEPSAEVPLSPDDQAAPAETADVSIAAGDATEPGPELVAESSSAESQSAPTAPPGDAMEAAPSDDAVEAVSEPAADVAVALAEPVLDRGVAAGPARGAASSSRPSSPDRQATGENWRGAGVRPRPDARECGAGSRCGGRRAFAISRTGNTGRSGKRVRAGQAGSAFAASSPARTGPAVRSSAPRTRTAAGPCGAARAAREGSRSQFAVRQARGAEGSARGRGQGAPLEHDPEGWQPIFRKDHARLELSSPRRAPIASASTAGFGMPAWSGRATPRRRLRAAAMSG